MKKEYESTIDDAVQSHYRLAELSGLVRRQMWLGLIWIPVIFLALYGVRSFSRVGWICAACILSFPVAVLHLFHYKADYRNNIRKLLVNALGSDNPYPCECELDEQGLVFRRLGEEIRFSWDNVREYNETTDTIELVMVPRGIAIIPKRIFDEPAELEAWSEFILDHMKSTEGIDEN